MVWFARQRRGPVSWKEQTLDSISAPPLPLLVFFGLFVMLMCFETYSNFKQRVERSKMGFRFGLFLLPLAGIVVAQVLMLRHRWRRYVFGVGKPMYHAVAEEGGPPWGLVVALVVLIVMVYYQSTFKSLWFRP